MSGLTSAHLGALLVTASLLAGDLPEIQKRGTLRALAVLSDEETYFVAQRPGLPPGFDIEVLEGFARLHGLKVELVPASGWDALVPSLLQGRGDVIAGGFTDTESRRRQIDFTVEVFPSRAVVMNRKPRPPIETLEGLRAEKVGTIKGTYMVEELAAAGLTGVDDGIASGGLPEALRSGRITAAVDGVEAALVAQSRDRDLQIGAFVGRPSSLAYGVRKEDMALRRALDEYLGNLRRTPTWNRLVVKYFGSVAPEILRKARTR
jgi:ABC-type amino acid transport substrate-binding protein